MRFRTQSGYIKLEFNVLSGSKVKISRLLNRIIILRNEHDQVCSRGKNIRPCSVFGIKL